MNGKVGNSMRVMFAVCAAVWLFLGGRVYGLLNLFGCHSALSRGLPFDLGYLGRAVLDFAHNISDSLASSLLMPACLSEHVRKHDGSRWHIILYHMRRYISPKELSARFGF